MKNNRQLFAAIVLATGLSAGMTACQESNTDKDSKEIAEDRNDAKFDAAAVEKNAQFVVDVSAGNYNEIEMAKLAKEKSSNSEVKEIAAMLEQDHQASNDKLQAYAQQNNISLPTAATDKAADDVKDLSDKKGVDFDKAWVEDQIDAHKSDIDKMEKAQNDVTDPELKAMITNTLPTLRSHLDKLMECHNKLK